MKIAPIDITHKGFSRKFNGVDQDEVSIFLKEVAEEMENIIRERNQLKEQLREREIQILEFKKLCTQCFRPGAMCVNRWRRMSR